MSDETKGQKAKGGQADPELETEAQGGNGAESDQGPDDGAAAEAARADEGAASEADASRTGYARPGLRAGDECVCPDLRKGTVHSFDAGLVCIPNHEQG